MKIDFVDNRKKVLTFKDLKVGDTFIIDETDSEEWEKDQYKDYVYVKAHPYYTTNNSHEYDEATDLNSFLFNKSMLTCIPANERVIKVNVDTIKVTLDD